MKIVFINGSPKKKLSVSSYLLGIVRLLVRGKVVSEQVRNEGDHERVLESIKDAGTVYIEYGYDRIICVITNFCRAVGSGFVFMSWCVFLLLTYGDCR